MKTKQLSNTTQKILVFLYAAKKPCMRSEIINAVQDTPRHVTNSLTTLVRHELVVKVKRNQYAVYLNIIITSELDGAVLGLQDSNLYGYLYEKVMLSVDTTVYNTEVRVRVKNTEVMIGNKQGYITPLVVKTPVHSTLFKDTVPCTPVSIQYIQVPAQPPRCSNAGLGSWAKKRHAEEASHQVNRCVDWR